MRCTGAWESTRRFAAAGGMFYTVESHVKHLREAKVGDALYVTTQVLGTDDKRLHVFHRLHRRGDDTLHRNGGTDAPARGHGARQSCARGCRGPRQARGAARGARRASCSSGPGSSVGSRAKR